MNKLEHPQPKSLLSILSILLLLAIAVAGGLALRPYLAERPAQAADVLQSEQRGVPPSPADSAAQPQPTTRSAEPEPSGQPLPAANGIQVQRVNDTEVSAANFRVQTDPASEQKQAGADVCFELRDSRDWVIWEASFLLDGQDITANEMFSYGTLPLEIREPPVDGQQRVFSFKGGQMTTRWEAAQPGTKGRRCDFLYFDVPPGANFSQVTIIVETLAVNPQEGEECTAAYAGRIQQELDRLESGITVGCVLEEWEGGGSAGVRIVDKPDWMSQGEAEAIMFALVEDVFLDLYGIRGPWVFTFAPEE